jgi:hypothetical protein
MREQGMDYRHDRLISARRIIVSALLAFLCGCSVNESAGSIPLRIENLYGVSVHIQYPVVVGTTAAVLNPIIQGWIGSNCNRSPVIRATYLGEATYRGAKECLAALSKECAALQAESGSSLLAVGPCQAEITAKAKLNTTDLLVIELYNFGSREHGFVPVAKQSADVKYLNLDVATGRILRLPDLLKPSYAVPLQRMIVHSLRTQLHIPGGEPLTEAGFATNEPPIPALMEIRPEGLRFVYRPGEITAGSVPRPRVLVSYRDLSGLIRENGPLRHLLKASTKIPLHNSNQ